VRAQYDAAGGSFSVIGSASPVESCGSKSLVAGDSSAIKGGAASFNDGALSSCDGGDLSLSSSSGVVGGGSFERISQTYALSTRGEKRPWPVGLVIILISKEEEYDDNSNNSIRERFCLSCWIGL
jgi:hypothetical protein